MRRRMPYRIVGGPDKFTIAIDESFWAEGLPLFDHGTETVCMELDANIEALCSELRYALYYVAIGEQAKH